MQNKPPFFSIIIPVYNVDQYVHKCIDSLLKQTFGNYEILLINDGSNDSSLSICENYQSQYANVFLYSFSNEGAAAARNKGLVFATGKYVFFMDSDDYIDNTDFLKKAYFDIQEAYNEVYFFGYKKLNTITDKIEIINEYPKELKSLTKEQLILKLRKTSGIPSSAWNTFIEKSFLDRNKIIFETGIVAEDLDWMCKVIRYSKTLSVISTIGYVYLKNRNNSVTSTSGIKSVRSLLFILDKWIPQLENQNDLINESLKSFLAFHYLTLFVTYPKLDSKERLSVYNEVKRYLYLFQYLPTNPYNIIAVFIIQCFGLNIGSMFLNRLYTAKNRFN